MMSLPAAARAALLAAVVAAVLVPPSVGGQVPGGHPMPKGPRPLHEVAAASDSIALGTIESVSEGRIRVREAIAIQGTVPAELELKRAPSNPPAFAPGDRVLLLLRGARSPYVLAEEPRESVVVPPGGGDRWNVALRTFQDVRTKPPALRDLYFSWLDGDDDGLRDLGLRGLYDPAAAFQPMPVALGAESARRALDPAFSAEVRRARAAVAVLSAEGYAVLAQDVLLPGTAEDGPVYEIVLQGSLLRRKDVENIRPALARGLRSSDAAVRQVAVRYAAGTHDEAIVAEVDRLAAEDPDAGVREAAKRAVASARSRSR